MFARSLGFLGIIYLRWTRCMKNYERKKSIDFFEINDHLPTISEY